MSVTTLMLLSYSRVIRKTESVYAMFWGVLGFWGFFFFTYSVRKYRLQTYLRRKLSQKK